MNWLESITLGVVQGLTEFLPISSSAHQLIVARTFFGNDGGGAAFTAVTQLGTEAAVLGYFWKDIWRIIVKWLGSLTGRVDRSDPDARMGWLVIIGSLPIAILGLGFKSLIEGPLRNLWITASMLLGFALVIAVADYLATRAQKKGQSGKSLQDLSWRDGLLYGLFQALALIPGVSRSGGTIAGGLFMGYSRPDATRYSFLLAIPAVLSSGLLQVFSLDGLGSSEGIGHIVVATIIAFTIGFAVISWLMRYISTHTFSIFVVYRLILAGVLFALLATGTIAATV